MPFFNKTLLFIATGTLGGGLQAAYQTRMEVTPMCNCQDAVVTFEQYQEDYPEDAKAIEAVYKNAGLIASTPLVHFTCQAKDPKTHQNVSFPVRLPVTLNIAKRFEKTQSLIGCRNGDEVDLLFPQCGLNSKPHTSQVSLHSLSSLEGGFQDLVRARLTLIDLSDKDKKLIEEEAARIAQETAQAEVDRKKIDAKRVLFSKWIDENPCLKDLDIFASDFNERATAALLLAKTNDVSKKDDGKTDSNQQS